MPPDYNILDFRLWPILLLIKHYSLLYSCKAALYFRKEDRITHSISFEIFQMRGRRSSVGRQYLG